MSFKRIPNAIALAILIAVGATHASAQIPEPSRQSSLKIITRTSQDSIVLRWAATDVAHWLTGNASGYAIERAVWNTADTMSYVRLVPGSLKPWSLDQWKPFMNKSHTYALIAAQALHGKAFDVKNADTSSMLAMFNKGSELATRFGFAQLSADLDPVAADGLALRFVDRTVKSGVKYVYRIFIDKVGTDSNYIPVAAVADDPLPKPYGTIARGKDGAVVLSWEGGGPTSPFSGYNVERSESENGTYTRLNTSPVLAINSADPTDTTISEYDKTRPHFMDTTVVNYRTYYYRVTGILPFGDVSGPSEAASAQGSNLEPPLAPDMTFIEQSGSNQITLRWTYDAKEAGRLKGFMVMRSQSYLNGYSAITDQLLSPSTREYTDKSAVGDTTNFYQVVAVDTAGLKTSSISRYGQIADTLPPMPPTGLTGTVDTNGVVRLQWKPNAERDVRGYRVFRSNSVEKGHEFIDVTGHPFLETSFTDTIVVKTLTKDVFYRLIAEDGNFNRSEFSEVLRLERPDLIPPLKPMIIETIAGDHQVILKWVPSQSADVKSQHLLRRRNGDADWRPIGPSMDPTIDSYQDDNVRTNERYEYTVYAIDSSGLRSADANATSAIPYDNGVRPQVSNVQIVADTAKRLIVIKWDYPKTNDVRFIIYRSRANMPLSQYESVDGSKREFTEPDPFSPGEYKYAVRAFYDDGGESVMSEVVATVLGEYSAGER